MDFVYLFNSPTNKNIKNIIYKKNNYIFFQCNNKINLSLFPPRRLPSLQIQIQRLTSLRSQYQMQLFILRTLVGECATFLILF
jgi:hypothetical protein